MVLSINRVAPTQAATANSVPGEAVSTGSWAAIATSNFCGPQFRGMWDDVEWHRRLTGLIHDGELPESAKK